MGALLYTMQRVTSWVFSWETNLFWNEKPKRTEVLLYIVFVWKLRNKL